MKLFLKLLVATIIVSVFSACSGRQTKSSTKSTKNTNDRSASLAYTDTVSFLSTGNQSVATVAVAVADEPKERNEGLMDVNTLPSDKGMLFIFDQQQELSFWMANTPLPLDIIFVNSDKEIVRIHRDAKPFAEQNFTSGEPALYVIETNAGFCVSHDIQEGMRVDF